MPRSSRRDELERAALELFVAQGYDGTSIADIAAVLDVSKAAVSYHFPAKDDLLVALASPLLDALEQVVAAFQPRLEGTDGARAFLDRYVAVLLANGELATWIDADRGVMAHAVVGRRLAALHDATRRLIGAGDDPASAIAAASALGALWRPIRNLDLPIDQERTLLVDAALAVLTSAAA